MDLLQAVIDHYTNGTEAEAVKLRELIGTDKLVIYDDQKNRQPPYVIIEEGGSQPIANALGNETTPGVRFDNDTVIFSVYAPSRSEVVAVLDALEDCFLRKPLTTTGKTCLGRPTLDPRPKINKLNDLYQGQTYLVYLMAK